MELFFYDIARPLGKDELALVTRARKEYAGKYRFPEDRARCLAAGFLLRSCLNLDDEMLKFGTAGKPCAKIEKLPFFNLSHAGDYVVLATAQNEVGVDIEPVHAYEDAVAERCLTPEEHAWRKRRGGKWAFYKLWTAKESVMKATGKGFTLPPESFCILPVDDSAHVIERRSWYLDWLYVECHIVCVAVENEREHIAVSFLR